MTRPLDTYTDIHSHRLDLACRGDVVVSISPGTEMLAVGTYSVGIHPWDTDKPLTLTTLRQMVTAAADPRVVAIGECGFDRLRGADIARQVAVFDFQARLAARRDLPLIIHCVKAFDILAGAVRRHRPTPGMWIVHGFRGKPALAHQLIDLGLALSLGCRFNADILAEIPPERLYHETDALN